MLIKFLKDFRGRETGEILQPAGKIVSVERELAEMLVHDGRAEFVLDPVDLAIHEVEVQAEAKAKPKPKSKKRGAK